MSLTKCSQYINEAISHINQVYKYTASEEIGKALWARDNLRKALVMAIEFATVRSVRTLLANALLSERDNLDLTKIQLTETLRIIRHH